MTDKELQQLVDIAKKHVYAIERRGDLEDRDNDSEDFVETSVWSIKAMLIEAYKLGQEQGK